MENHSFDGRFGMLGRGDGFKLDAQRQAARRQPDDGRPAPARVPHAVDLSAATARPARTGWRATPRSTTGATTASSRRAARSRWATGTRPTSPSTTGSRKTFPLCDRYFCSVLAQTYPEPALPHRRNRVGRRDARTSRTSRSSRPRTARSSTGSHAHGISWRDYATDLPGVAVIARRPRTSTRRTSSTIDQFYKDAAAGTLPSVSFVDPRFDTDPGGVRGRSRRHRATARTSSPKVVNAVFHSPNWKNTVLIYTYDEHGGYYDHVPPPPAVKPDNIAPGVDVAGHHRRVRPLRLPRADRHRVAVREARTTCRTQVHDHTSILKLIETKWNLGALTYRDANASNLLDSLDLVGPARVRRAADAPRARASRDRARRARPAARSRPPARSCPRARRRRFGSARRPSVVAMAVDVRTRIDGPRPEFDPDAVLRRRAARPASTSTPTRSCPRSPFIRPRPLVGRGRRRRVDAHRRRPARRDRARRAPRRDRARAARRASSSPTSPTTSRRS